MNNNILRTAKVKDNSKLTALAEHNFRIRTQFNIDDKKSHLNKVLVNTLNVDTTDASDLQKKINGHYQGLKIKPRKDSVMAMEFLISASPEWFKGKTPSQVNEWANSQVDFMRQQFGDNLKLAVLHLDEKTPHIHFLVTPEKKSLKVYKNRDPKTGQLREYPKETWSLDSRRWNPEFLVDLHTAHALHNEELDLVRGVPGSARRHKTLKKFYSQMDKTLGSDYSKYVDELSQQVEINILSPSKTRQSIMDVFKSFTESIRRAWKAKRKLLDDVIAGYEKEREQFAELLSQKSKLDARAENYKKTFHENEELKLENKSQKEENERLNDANQKLREKFEELKQSYTKKNEIDNHSKLKS